MSASAGFPSCGLSYRRAESFLLVIPRAAVAEEMLPRLSRSFSATPALVVLSVSEPL